MIMFVDEMMMRWWWEKINQTSTVTAIHSCIILYSIELLKQLAPNNWLDSIHPNYNHLYNRLFQLVHFNPLFFTSSLIILYMNIWILNMILKRYINIWLLIALTIIKCNLDYDYQYDQLLMQIEWAIWMNFNC